jgi:hypothetical protein
VGGAVESTEALGDPDSPASSSRTGTHAPIRPREAFA